MEGGRERGMKMKEREREERGKEGRKIDSTATEKQILARPCPGPATIRFCIICPTETP